MRRVVRKLIFISYKCELIVTFFYSNRNKDQQVKSEEIRVDFLLFADAVNTMLKCIYSNSDKF